MDVWGTWSDYAQDFALAWQARESRACPQGHHADVWDQDYGGDMLARVQLRHHVCPACEAVERDAKHSSDEDRWPGEYVMWEPVSLPEQDSDHEQQDECED